MTSRVTSAVKALEARTWCSAAAAAPTAGFGATEIATKSKPTSAPDAPAAARKRSWIHSGSPGQRAINRADLALAG
jgi:hypothetical protein